MAPGACGSCRRRRSTRQGVEDAPRHLGQLADAVDGLQLADRGEMAGDGFGLLGVDAQAFAHGFRRVVLAAFLRRAPGDALDDQLVRHLEPDRDLERLAKFENRLFAKYAKTYGLAFVDIAGQLPFDPDLFLDAVHTSYAGTRMRGWITLNALIPLIEKHLAAKSWPRPMPNPEPPLPTINPRKVTLDCKPS